jgi:ferritin-like metal-binding protein YciE
MEQVQSEELRQALDTHAQETRQQFDMLQPLTRGSQPMPCMSMRALFEEAQQMVGQIQDPDARDAYVIAAAQAIEHHEIAAYGTARAWAEQLGRGEDVRVLEQILNQEKKTDALLTQLAERRVNKQAADGSMQSDREVSMSTGREMGAQGGSQGRSSAGGRGNTELSVEG